MADMIFISHCEQDKEISDIIADRICQTGFLAYMAEKDPRPGTILANKISNAIGNSRFIIVLISESSNESQYVQQEIGIAYEKSKTIIPISIDGAKPKGVLAGKEYIDFTKENLEQSMDKFQRVVESQKAEMNRNDFWGGIFLVGAVAGAVYLLMKTSEKEDKQDE